MVIGRTATVLFQLSVSLPLCLRRQPDMGMFFLTPRVCRFKKVQWTLMSADVSKESEN